MKKKSEAGQEKPLPLNQSTSVASDLHSEASLAERSASELRSVIASPLTEAVAVDLNAPETDLSSSETDRVELKRAPAEALRPETIPESPNILEELAEKQSDTQEKSLSAYESNRRRIREQKKRRRLSHLKRALLVFTLVLSCGLLLYYLPLFHVQTFQLEGLKHMTEQEVIAASGIQKGDHLFKNWGGGLARFFSLRNGSAEDRISAAFPYVNTVKVNTKLPGTIRIAIDERIPVSYLDYQGACVLLDKDGIVLEIKKGGAPAGIPLILNSKLTDPLPGQMVSDETKRSIRPAMLVLDAVVSSDANMNDGFSLFHQIETIRLSDDGPETSLTIKEDWITPGSEVKLGNRQTLEDAINWLRYALRTGVVKSQGKGTFDLTGTRKFFYPDKN